MKSFVHVHKTFLLSIGFLVVFATTVTLAVPPSTKYNPGETLDPTCAPGSSNCSVLIASGGSSQWDDVTNGINYAGGRVGIGTTTPQSALDVSGEIRGGNLNIVGSSGSVAAPSNPQAVIQYDPSAYNYNNDGHETGYHIYSYKIINGDRVYSASYAEVAITDDGNNDQTYAISVSWDAASGADGYRVLVSYYGSAFESGYDTTSTSFVDGDGSVAFDGSPSSYVVTPSSAFSNANTINGAVAITGNTSINGISTVSGTANFQSNIIAAGTYGSGTILPDLGSGTRMVWNPNKAAFRAGGVSADQWDGANVGNYSFATGNDTIASANYSAAFGSSSVASGSTSMAFGNVAVASGQYAVAFGDHTVASGSRSTALGSFSLASGQYSLAFGDHATASSQYSIAIGGYNTASGSLAVAIGGLNTASAPYSSVLGGFSSTASGQSSTVVGGDHNLASGNFSTAFGVSTIASAIYSTAFGNFTTASGNASTAFGEKTVAGSLISTAFGTYNIGGGDPGNWIGTDPLLEVGNGSNINGNTIYSNALTILKNGNVGIYTPTPGTLLSVGGAAYNSTLNAGIIAHFENDAGSCDLDPTNTGGIVCTSDMNAKKNITLLSDNSAWSFNNNVTADNNTIFAKLIALTPVQYNFNTENDNEIKHTGFIAQEVEQLFPDLITINAQGRKSMNYVGLVPYSIQAIKEMSLNITDISNLDRDNNWRTSLIAWFGNANNGITSFFSKQVTTPTLCVGTDDSKTCITKTQLDTLLQNQGGGSTTVVSPAPSVPVEEIPVPAEEPAPAVEEAPVVEEEVQPETPEQEVVVPVETPAPAPESTE